MEADETRRRTTPAARVREGGHAQDDIGRRPRQLSGVNFALVRDASAASAARTAAAAAATAMT